MKEYREGVYKKAGIGPVIMGFIAIIFLALIGALVFFLTGHPKVPMSPQPKNNKGQLVLSTGTAAQV